MQRLEVYQSLWDMELRNPSARERTPEEAFAQFADADGRQQELSNRWDESLQIRDWVCEIWAELETELTATQS